MTSLSQLSHQTRHLASIRSSARGLWSDDASKHIEQRFLRPHEAAATEMVGHLEQMQRAAQRVGTAVEQVRSSAIEAYAAAERVGAEVTNSQRSQASTYEYAQQAWQHEHTAAKHEARALQLAESTRSMCDGCPTSAGDAGHAVSVRLADRADLEDGRLTDDEINALREYTAAGHGDMNSELRGFEMVGGDQVDVHIDRVEQDAARLATAMRGLKKLPAHQGEVFRGTTMRPQDLDRYKEGAVVVQSSFVSASTSRDVAEKFRAKSGGNVMMQITSANGRDISTLSTYSAEREVLFNYSSRFEVMAVSQVGSVTHIVAREV